MVIRGFKIGSTDLTNIEMVINEIRRELAKKISKTYHKLLGEEIAFLCDNIATGAVQRDMNRSVYDIAVQNLQVKIHKAQITRADNTYTLQAFAHIMTFKDETYFNLICPSWLAAKEFKHVTPYSLTEEEAKDKKNAKTETWSAIHTKYAKSEPVQVKLTDDYIDPDKEKIVYPKLKERCATVARHNVLNHYLSLISGGEQIAPVELMPDMELAIEMATSEEGERLIRQKTMELTAILIDLEKDDSVIYEIPAEKEINS